jgi:hypothetical protein
LIAFIILAYLFCRIHDFDKNDKLDGLEVLKAVNHVMAGVRSSFISIFDSNNLLLFFLIILSGNPAFRHFSVHLGNDRVLTKENTVLTKINTVLKKKNTVFTKVNRVLTKENTVLTKVNTFLTKESTVITKKNSIDVGEQSTGEPKTHCGHYKTQFGAMVEQRVE